MKYLLLILTAATLVSCSPERRLARLIERHPELVHTDTVYTTITIPADTVTVTETVTVEADTAEVSSLVDSLLIAIAGMDPHVAKPVAERIITERIRKIAVFPTETMTYDTGVVTGTLWFEPDGKLHIETVVKEKKIEVPVETNDVRPVKNVAWIERLFWILVIVAGIAYGIYQRFYSPRI